MFFILLDHVTGKGRQAATQERAVGVGRETDASMTKDYATTTRTDTVGQPPRARDGESSQVASNTNSQGIKARRIGRNKSCGEKAKGLQVRGFIGSRERLARALSLSLSLQKIWCPACTGKAATLVALSQADPQLPMAGLVSRPSRRRESCL
jgi:hypothetical protein